MSNALYYGDNLAVLRESIASESIDLIYLDPPFNSNASYNVLFKAPTGEQSQAQIEAFEDTWHWNIHAEQAFDETIKSGNTDAAELLRAMRAALGDNDMTAYLAMMAIRLIELHRVLKPSGSLYLHCDPTASHYLKIVMDAVFEGKNFLNELIWYYRGAGVPKDRRAKRHDVLLVYAKKEGLHYFNPDPIRRPYAEATVERFSHYIGNVRGGVDFGVQTLNPLGKHPDDVITNIQPIAPSARDRLGYPTQKPLELLEEVLNGSSKEGEIVLDPFCGCGTTVHAAQKLKRKWIGIDITHLAIGLIERRVKDAFPEAEFEVHGTPKDFAGAENLALRDKYQFQWWAVTLINAVPYGGKKKGADSGIDGYYYCKPDGKKTEAGIVSVKGGETVHRNAVGELRGVVERDKAPLGVLITLRDPTGPMKAEAASAGFLETPFGKFQRLQVVTVGDLLEGKLPKLPPQEIGGGYKLAPKEATGKQDKLI